MSTVGYDKENNSFWKIKNDYVPAHYSGTGDMFTSVLIGGLLKGDSLPIAMNRATAFTELTVKTTYSYQTHGQTVLCWRSASLAHKLSGA